MADKTMRVGKTQKDRELGANGRNESNKAERTEWMRNNGKGTWNFPSNTCNGKKNRLNKKVKKGR